LGEKFFEIEGEPNSSFGLHIEAGSQLNPRKILIVGEMENEALGFFLNHSVMALKSKEDVASGPGPVKIIKVGIERVVCGMSGGIFVIGFRWNPNTKANSLVKS
tara:strand:- start:8 stop:319 length:312 start_codon:yes stop_codon:yes gene_type:complete